MTSSLILPDGTSTSAISPIRFPKRLLPMGDTLDILPWEGSASVLPTMVYLMDRPSWSLTAVRILNLHGVSASRTFLDDDGVVNHAV